MVNWKIVERMFYVGLAVLLIIKVPEITIWLFFLACFLIIF